MLRKIERVFKNIIRSKRGQGITEYAAILAIVVAIAVVISANDSFKGKITQLYSDMAGKIQELSGIKK